MTEPGEAERGTTGEPTPEGIAEVERRARAEAPRRLAEARGVAGNAAPAGTSAPQRGRLRWLTLVGLVVALAVIAGVFLLPRLTLLAAVGRATPAPTSITGAGIPCARAQPPFENVRVSHDAYLAHSEPMLAEDPRDPKHLVGGSKFFTDPARYRFQIGTFASFDGGCTWQDGGVLPGFAASVITSDVSLGIGSHGAVYAAVLHAVTRGESGLAVSTSTDGGRSFGAPADVFTDKRGTIFSDKPWMVVDTTGGARDGSVYVVWSYQYGGDCGYGNACRQEVAFARSTDGGKTWSAPRMIEGSAPFCDNPATGRPAASRLCDAAQGPIPVVMRDGSLAVVFAYEDLMSGDIPTRLIVVSSHDGGETWTPPVLVDTIHDVAGGFPPNRYRNVTLPALAAEPGSNRLYLAWADKRNGTADVLFSSSADGGATWSRPFQRVNDDPAGTGSYHFQPQIAVAPGGVVTVSWFDTRNDPRHRLIDVYLAQSTDHGASFRRNVRVTTTSWDPAVDAPVDGGGSQFIGDYQGLAVDDAFVHPFWNDTRSGAQEIFTAAVPSARLARP